MRPLPNLLAIDTSSPVLSVAVKKQHEMTSEICLEGFMEHARNLLPMIDELLVKSGLKIGDIDAFLIGRGPGSFTGLKIGFATIKGFRAAREKPCYGALSLDMIAARIPRDEISDLGVCLDARQEKIYGRFYRLHKGKWEPQGRAGVVAAEEMIAKFPPGSCISGDALRRYSEVIEKRGNGNIKELYPEPYWYPRASTLIEWFGHKKTPLKQLRTPADFVPLYLRQPEPIERKRARAKNR